MDMKKPPASRGFSVERVTRIELALSAWEADVLPLNYTRGKFIMPEVAGPGQVGEHLLRSAPSASRASRGSISTLAIR